MGAEVVEDLWLEYKDGRGADVRCRARLFKVGSNFVLIATDAGHFLTQTIDRVATIMVRRWELDPPHVSVVEHFERCVRPAGAPPATDARTGEPGETFAFVGFTWRGMLATNPTWVPTTRARVQELLAGLEGW